MSKPRWQRALISFAGPAVNLIFPIFLLTGLFTMVGVPYPSYLNEPVHVTGLPPNSDSRAKPVETEATTVLVWINGIADPELGASLPRASQSRSLPRGQTIVKMEVEEDSGTRQTIEVPIKDKSESPARIFGYHVPIRPIIDQVAQGAPADRAGLAKKAM